MIKRTTFAIFLLMLLLVAAVRLPTASANNGHFTLVNRSGEMLYLIEVLNNENNDVTVFNFFFTLNNGEQLDVDVSGITKSEHYGVRIGCGNGTMLYFSPVNVMGISRMIINSDETAQFE